MLAHPQNRTGQRERSRHYADLLGFAVPLRWLFPHGKMSSWYEDTVVTIPKIEHYGKVNGIVVLFP